MPLVDDVTADLARAALDIAQLRAETASRNVANADVAGYRPEQVDFASVLARLRADLADPEALAQTVAGLRQDGVPVTLKLADSVLGASVNLDDEMVEITVAGAQYQTLADALSRHFGLMRLAVQGRS